MVISGVVRWLSRHDRWLLAIDNLDGETVNVAERRLPSELPGHVLITSQRPLLGLRHTLEPLPLEAATDFLLRRTRHPDADVARAVADRLGCLPLALEQASAHLDQTGEQLIGYAELLETSLAKVQAEGRVANHPRSVVATWAVSFQRVERRSSAAADLLRVCAFLGPEAIPLGLLEQAADALPPESELVAAIGDRTSLNPVIGVLLDYSLVSRLGNQLTLHRLIQAVVRDSLSDANRQRWASSAVRMLSAEFPASTDDPATWADCQELLPHALAAADHAIERGLEPTKSASLLGPSRHLSAGARRVCAGQDAYERALDMRERVLGADHPDTATSLNTLASVLHAQGDLAAARPLFKRALAIHERVLGPDDPNTALSLNTNSSRIGRQTGEAR